MIPPIIFTIGYGGTNPDIFFSYLTEKMVDVVIDVRTRPRGYLGSYTAPAIGRILEKQGIRYINDKRLGGLDDIDPVEFMAGIDQVMSIANEGHMVCLMCSEKDPHKCHR